MSSGITSAVQVIATAAMSPVQGSQLSGNIDPENESSYFDDLYGGTFLLSGTDPGSSIVDAPCGQLESSLASTDYPKFNDDTGSDPFCLACRFSGKNGQPEPLTVSFRARSNGEPVVDNTGNMNFMVCTKNTVNPGTGFYGVRVRFQHHYAAGPPKQNANTLAMEMFSNNSTAVASAVLWSDNEDYQASEQLAPEGFNTWSEFHEYTLRIECATATTTKVSLYIDGSFVKSLTGALDSNNRLYKFCGNLGGGSYAGKPLRVDSVHIQQSRV